MNYLNDAIYGTDTVAGARTMQRSIQPQGSTTRASRRDFSKPTPTAQHSYVLPTEHELRQAEFKIKDEKGKTVVVRPVTVLVDPIERSLPPPGNYYEESLLHVHFKPTFFMKAGAIKKCTCCWGQKHGKPCFKKCQICGTQNHSGVGCPMLYVSPRWWENHGHGLPDTEDHLKPCASVRAYLIIAGILEHGGWSNFEDPIVVNMQHPLVRAFYKNKKQPISIQPSSFAPNRRKTAPANPHSGSTIHNGQSQLIAPKAVSQSVVTQAVTGDESESYSVCDLTCATSNPEFPKVDHASYEVDYEEDDEDSIFIPESKPIRGLSELVNNPTDLGILTQEDEMSWEKLDALHAAESDVEMITTELVNTAKVDSTQYCDHREAFNNVERAYGMHGLRKSNAVEGNMDSVITLERTSNVARKHDVAQAGTNSFQPLMKASAQAVVANSVDRHEERPVTSSVPVTEATGTPIGIDPRLLHLNNPEIHQRMLKQLLLKTNECVALKMSLEHTKEELNETKARLLIIGDYLDVSGQMIEWQNLKIQALETALREQDR